MRIFSFTSRTAGTNIYALHINDLQNAVNEISTELSNGIGSVNTTYRTLKLAASTTGAASLNMPSGTAPTTPVSGDVWNASGTLTYYDGSQTRTLSIGGHTHSGANITSGTVGIQFGGTGQSTAAAAFDALSPLTTLGDLLYEGASASARLPGNTSSQLRVLGQTGTGTVSAIPAWTALTGGFSVTIGNGVDLIGTGYQVPMVMIPYACNVDSIYAAHSSGTAGTGKTIAVTITKSTRAQFPATVATVGTVSTTAATDVAGTVSAAALAANDIIRFNVTSNTDATKLTIGVFVTRTS